MDEIQVELVEAGEDSKPVTIEDTLTILENNRKRVRDLSAMVLTVCGLLLSTSFVILFFVIQNKPANVYVTVLSLLFMAIASLIVSILSSILASILPSPTAVRTKFELINVLGKTYHREYRRVTIAVIFLFLAIILFTVSLVVFSFTSI